VACCGSAGVRRNKTHIVAISAKSSYLLSIPLKELPRLTADCRKSGIELLVSRLIVYPPPNIGSRQAKINIFENNPPQECIGVIGALNMARTPGTMTTAT
jgi:hypothetical protein